MKILLITGIICNFIITSTVYNRKLFGSSNHKNKFLKIIIKFKTFCKFFAALKFFLTILRNLKNIFLKIKKILKINLNIILRKFEKILQSYENFAEFCCTTILNCRPKIIVYVSCIKFLGSCIYRYTRYTTFSCIVFRTLINTYFTK